MDDKFYNEEIKDKNDIKENEPQKTEGSNFVMIDVKEEKKEAPAENKEDPKKEFYSEQHKAPKKKKGGVIKFVAALLIISIFGGVSVGAGYGAVKFLVMKNGITEETTGTPSTPVAFTIKGDDAAVAVIDKVFPSVVNISISGTMSQNFYGYMVPYEYESAGSGIIFDEDDEKIYIATNNHVVDGATNIVVSIANEDGVAANVVGKDASSDLAVISVSKKDLAEEGITNVRIAEFGNSDNINVGQDVIAIGNALGEGKVATGGMISSKQKTITIDEVALTVMQTDSAINPGNSGGALVDYEGKVIGINTAKTSSSQIEGIGYAIPSNIAVPILETLLEEGTIPKPYLGIMGKDVTDELAEKLGLPVGAYISQVLEGSGAEKAGLKEGDIITDFAGVKIMNMDILIETVSDLKVGDVVDIRVIRNGSEIVETKVEILNANSL